LESEKNFQALNFFALKSVVGDSRLGYQPSTGMESQDPIEQSLNRLNLGDNQKLKERAQYYYSQCSKVPPRVFSKGMNARPIISIHLACERYDIHIT
jgi:hypothetical protein